MGNNMKYLKQFVISFAVCLFAIPLALTISAFTGSKTVELFYRDIKVKIDGEELILKDANGEIIEPFIIDGTTYLPVRAIAEAVGYNVGWDNENNTAVLDKRQSELKAELSNYRPARNDTILLSVTGKDYEGLPYIARCYYRTTQTEYIGVVGRDPCEIRISSATIDHEVPIIIIIDDELNYEQYKIYTSFTPTAASSLG